MLARTASGDVWQALTVVTVGGGSDTPPCSSWALCYFGADALTRPSTLSNAVTYDLVDIRSLVEHVRIIERVRPRSPVEVLSSEDEVFAMSAASADADSHAYNPAAHFHVQPDTGVGGPDAPDPPPPAGRARDLGAVAEDVAPVSAYSNAPAGKE